jgi:hypothetical protein
LAGQSECSKCDSWGKSDAGDDGNEKTATHRMIGRKLAYCRRKNHL